MAERNTNAAPDVLQLNMEIISKELNDLIVTGEQEIGVTQQFSMAAVKTTAHALMTAPVLENNFQAPTYIAHAFYGQQRLYDGYGLQNMTCNLNYPTLQLTVPTKGCITTPNVSYTKNYLYAGKYLSSSTVEPTQAAYTNATGAPSYEFHYLRSRGDNVKKFTGSMSSLGGHGAYRKMAKLSQKHFNNQKTQNSVADNEEINFDLSLLDFLNYDKQNSIVRHLFDLLRDLHHAVAETLPSFEVDTDSQFEETFAPSTNKKSAMPATLNVQNQVKQACRKLTIFTYEMQRILSANKMFDIELNAECEFYLNHLRQYLNQLEMYKRIVMEHKQGKFLREEVKVHAERLSLLLEHTNRQIREVNLRVLAADWYIGLKYRGDVHVAAMQLNTCNNNEISNKSKIGVINEILQMCNMNDSTAAKANAANATTTGDETTKSPTSTKPYGGSTTNSPIKLINSNQEVVTIKPILYKNNDIFSVYKPEQIKRATSSGTSTHVRHPVFYIG